MRQPLIFPILMLGALGASLQGCTGFEGAKHTLDPEGPTSLDGYGDKSYSVYSGPVNSKQTTENSSTDTRENVFVDDVAYSKTTGLIKEFEIEYAKSYNDKILLIEGSKLYPASSGDEVSKDFRSMAVAGVALADSYCADFFIHAGNNQKWLDVFKDTIAVAGTLATGIFATSSSKNSAASQATALFTATAYNGVDLYTRNFLFGADNIQSVQSMIIKLLSDHKSSVLPADDKTIWTFEGAVEVIADHQALCTPAAIRDKVLSAIAGGKFKAYTPAGKALSPTDQSPKTATTANDKIAAATEKAAANIPQAALLAAPAAAGAEAGATKAAEAEAKNPAGTTLPKVIAAALLGAKISAKEAATDAATVLGSHASLADIDAVAEEVAKTIAPAVAKATFKAFAERPIGPPATRHVQMKLVNPDE